MLLANEKKTTQDMLDRLVGTGKSYRMGINVVGLKVMRISGREEPLRITVGNYDLKNVDEILYLGILVTRDAYYTKEIRSFIAMATLGTLVFTKRRSLLTNNSAGS